MRAPLSFRLLLRLYPASFRREYGGEMARVFDERRREAAGARALASLWLATIADAVHNAARTHGDILRQDVAYAVRTLGRAPGFTATVMLVAALGIGANAAAFSLADHVLIRPLPFAEPERLVAIWEEHVGQGLRIEPSPANWRDWKLGTRSFDGMAAAAKVSANLVGEGEPERLEGATVTADLPPVLGAHPALGRLFFADDDRDGAPGTVLLSWSLWQAGFAGDTGIVGRTVRLDGEPHTVIGVMPPGFAYPSRETQFWKPFRFDGNAFDERGNNYLRVVARLKPGVTLDQARADLGLVSERLAREYPTDNAGTRANVLSLRDEVSRQSRLLVIVLAAAAACVLLIACLNLANLLLARALARRKELALRVALGAGPERLVRQLLTESMLLALGGGALGIAFALLSWPLLARLIPAQLPVGAPAMDLRVLSVAALVTVLAALAFGVAPALRACRAVAVEDLRDGTRTGTGTARSRLVRAVVVAEVSASLLLLVSSGLLLRALAEVQSRDPGFHAQSVLTLRTWLPQPRYAKTSERTRFYQHVLSRVRALPGVERAAYISYLPMAMPGGIWPVEIPSQPVPPGQQRTISLRYVTPDLFATMHIPLRAGRDVSDGDAQDRPFVAVVSESFARRYWPNGEAVGKQIKVAFFERTIVGVVGDVRVRGLERDSEPQVYLPHQQVPDGWMTSYPPKDLVVRSSLDRAALLPPLRAIIREADAQQPISDVRTLGEIVSAQTAPRRTQLDVIGVFAALAILLAGIGIYGLLSFAVSNRAQEIGVRMALGATPARILGMILQEGLGLATVGAVIGVALCWVAGRWLEALLVGVPPTDTVTLAGALVVVLVMTVAGSLVPAWRAARVEPAVVMRAE